MNGKLNKIPLGECGGAHAQPPPDRVSRPTVTGPVFTRFSPEFHGTRPCSVCRRVPLNAAKRRLCENQRAPEHPLNVAVAGLCENRIKTRQTTVFRGTIWVRIGPIPTTSVHSPVRCTCCVHRSPRHRPAERIGVDPRAVHRHNVKGSARSHCPTIRKGHPPDER